MRVICAKTGKNVSISRGTEYTVVSQTDNRFTLINDKGVEKNYCKSLFTEVNEERVQTRRQAAPAPIPVAPPIRIINEIDIAIEVSYDDDGEQYNILLRGTTNDDLYTKSSNCILNNYNSAISCGITQINGLNNVLRRITTFKNELLSELETIENCRVEITSDDISESDILTALLNSTIEESGDIGLLLISTNITNNDNITPEYIEVLDNISIATAETYNPNSRNRIKMWTLQVTE